MREHRGRPISRVNKPGSLGKSKGGKNRNMSRKKAGMRKLEYEEEEEETAVG